MIKKAYLKTVLIIALPFLIGEYVMKEAHRSFVKNTQFKLAVRTAFRTWLRWWNVN